MISYIFFTQVNLENCLHYNKNRGRVCAGSESISFQVTKWNPLLRPTLGLAAKLCCSLFLLAATAISGAQKSVKRFRNEPPKPAADWPHSGIALYVGGTIFSAAQISQLPLWTFCKVSEVPILMCSLSFPIEVLGLVADVYTVNLDLEANLSLSGSTSIASLNTLSVTKMDPLILECGVRTSSFTSACRT